MSLMPALVTFAAAARNAASMRWAVATWQHTATDDAGDICILHLIVDNDDEVVYGASLI